MATNLYEILGLDQHASPEEVRKAYRRRALHTHPDRLPLNSSESEKAVAAEEFRKINNAYEVLDNAQNRALYDRHGVWPPPLAEQEPLRRNSQNRNSSDAFAGFFNSPFDSGSRRSPWGGFTDPFELFNAFFAYMNRRFDDPFFGDDVFSFPRSRALGFPFHDMTGPFGQPTRPSFGVPGGSMLAPPMFPAFMDMGGGSDPFSQTRSYSAVSHGFQMGGQSMSQSRMSRTINGRTETIYKRRDADGNEHITYSSPEGERYTINGVEQPLDNRLASAPRPPPPQAITAPPRRPDNAPEKRHNTHPEPTAYQQPPPAYTSAPPVIPQAAYPARSRHGSRHESMRATKARVPSEDGENRRHRGW